MSLQTNDLKGIAEQYNVDLSKVRPLTFEERNQELASLLADDSVPFPIDPRKAKSYLAAAEEGAEFSVGALSDNVVDLGEYRYTQDYSVYDVENEHLCWACLVRWQKQTKLKFACQEYIEGEKKFEISEDYLPDYYILNARIYQQTGWQLATVKEIIPADLFFTCHSNQFFPVTSFMRSLDEISYLEKPDMGHDVAGHVATFTIPEVRLVMKNHGDARNLIFDERDAKLADVDDQDSIQKINAWAENLLSIAGRIYWYTIEFGLVLDSDRQVKAYGAGILSSPSETEFSILGDADFTPTKILIDPSSDQDLLRLAVTDYQIREYQKTYFVIQSFDLLASLTPERILEVSKEAMALPHVTWNELLEGDKVLAVGTTAMSPNEKYFRLMNEDPLALQSENSSDYTIPITAVRNLRLRQQPDAKPSRHKLPTIPDSVIAWFEQNESSFPADLGPYRKQLDALSNGYGDKLWPI